ncbi:MAG: ABC-type transport auxiliary lipoprotein family protein [Gammaproteobacteria bacterium]
MKHYNLPLLTLYLTLATGLLSACMGGAAPPRDHYYRLTADTALPRTPTTLTYSHIGVLPSVARGLYAERPLLYVDTEAPLELQQYHYHHWHDVPARLLQQHLVDWLQRQAPASRIVALDYGASVGQARGALDNPQREALLLTRIQRFERNITGSHIEVLVELDISLQQDQQVVHQQTYRQHVRLTDNTMQATVQAFADALEAIYSALLDNLRR